MEFFHRAVTDVIFWPSLSSHVNIEDNISSLQVVCQSHVCSIVANFRRQVFGVINACSGPFVFRKLKDKMTTLTMLTILLHRSQFGSCVSVTVIKIF